MGEKKPCVNVYFLLLVEAYVTVKYEPAQDSVFLWKLYECVYVTAIILFTAKVGQK